MYIAQSAYLSTGGLIRCGIHLQADVACGEEIKKKKNNG